MQHTSGRNLTQAINSPLEHFHLEVDRLFDQAFRGFGFSPFGLNQALVAPGNGAMLKPTLDLSANDKEYTIALEISGVGENDVSLEIVNDTLTIQGDKKHENEEKGKNYYRIECSYGSFQRTLSLPDDVDQDSVTAAFNNGVLTVTMPRKALPQGKVRQIEVKRS